MKRIDHEDIKSILNSIEDGVFITDAEGNVVFMNDASVDLCEYDRDQLIGRNVRDLVDEGYFSENEVLSLRCIKSGKKESLIQSGRNGEHKVTVTAVPLFQDKKMKFVVVTERDVSDINRLERELRKSKELAEKYQTQLIKYMKVGSDEFENIMYDSKEMDNIFMMANKVAQKDVSVLIQGESGTGKEVVAKYIHQSSDRSDGPFVKVNCNAIPETLFESELFGYEKGAFTGASEKGKAGLFELADKGTLFLDEIGIMPIALQGKLLRVLQNQEIMRVGGETYIPVDVRIIAATNIDLKEAVKTGKFRLDLYYRLNVVPIVIPPLRERRDDIIPLTKHFLQVYNEKFETNVKMRNDAWNVLRKHKWPGNVRELENLIKRLVIISDEDQITGMQISEQFDDLGLGVPDDLNAKNDLRRSVEEYEKNLIVSKMRKYRSSTELAEALGIDKSTLNRKIKKYDIDRYFSDTTE